MRMQLLGADVMPDSVALNMLDLCLRVHEPWLSDVRTTEQQQHDEKLCGMSFNFSNLKPAAEAAAVDWSYCYSEHARIQFDRYHVCGRMLTCADVC